MTAPKGLRRGAVAPTRGSAGARQLVGPVAGPTKEGWQARKWAESLYRGGRLTR